MQYLEDQLAAVEQKLKKSYEDAEVLSRLNKKRETRLREADAQIAVVQHEWITAHAATRNEILALQKECTKLKRVFVFYCHFIALTISYIVSV